jgi:glycoside/pentoside/hexuronide:cation symporter, GPH family
VNPSAQPQRTAGAMAHADGIAPGTAPGPAASTAPISTREGLRYGLLGLPLAFVALPLYVVLPNHYARELGAPLATLGALLLGARLFDALIDPWLGRLSDRLFARSAAHVLRVCMLCAVLLALGFVALFFPPVRGSALLAWALAALLVTYTAFSMVSVAYQSWGARLGGDTMQRSRIVAWREGLGLIGVLTASILPVVAGLPVSTSVFIVALALGMTAWATAQPPVVAASARTSVASGDAAPSVWLPFTRPGFKALLAVFVLNGIASAIPATLVLFFIQDLLQAPAQWEGVFLLAYFLTAAASIPLWLRVIARRGLRQTWLVGMLLAVLVFIGAATLGPMDIAWYLLVCALSGVALGADLAAPPALLAGLIQTNGDHGSNEGAYFGWWNFATKLNLALAAGLALPILQLFGYAPGARSPQALQALVVAYCVIPCALKLIAAYALYTWSNSQKHT